MGFNEELRELRIKHFKTIYPKSMDTGYFDHVLEVKKPTSAAQLEKLIVEFINFSGHQAHKTEVKGTFVPSVGKKLINPMTGEVKNKGQYIPSGARKGQADVTSTIYGLRVEWEVKFSKGDRQSVHQKKYEDDIVGAGGFYFIVRDVDDFYNKWLKLMDHDKIKLLASTF